MYIILGALGYQGEAVLHYLYNTLDKTDMSIVAVDMADTPSGTINSHMFSDDCIFDIRYLKCKLSTVWSPDESYEPLNRIKNEDVTVINCLPTEYIINVFTYCLTRAWNVIDLGGVTEITLQQMKSNEAMRKRNKTAVTDVGLAPGIVLARASEIARNDKAQGIDIYCCGLPKYPEPPLFYSEVFYLDGVRKEYSGVAQEIVDGEVKSFPTLTGKEYIAVPSLGVLEARRTSGGLSVGAEKLDLRHLSYKTLRYPGHWDYIEKYIMPQKDPTAILKSMTQKVSFDNPDIIYLAFHIDYGDGDPEIEEYFWEYDRANNIGAMAQATGFTAAAVARKVHDGEVPVGVIGMHEISADEIINEIRTNMPNQYNEMPIVF